VATTENGTPASSIRSSGRLTFQFSISWTFHRQSATESRSNSESLLGTPPDDELTPSFLSKFRVVMTPDRNEDHV